MNFDIVNLGPSLSILSNDISIDYVNNTTLSVLSDTIDDEFTTTITYVDDEVQEQHEYTDQEIENLRNEGYIQEAVTQILAWATSDEGKRFRIKAWDRIKFKWLTFTSKRPYTELIDDIANASTDELDDMLKDNFGSAIAGIRADPVQGKDIVMKGTTYIYNGD
jgi:hypothetical protein